MWSQPTLNGAPILNYTLYKDTGSGQYYPIYVGSALTYTDTLVDVGTSYNYKIKATNAAGDSSLSSIVTATAAAPPG